MLLNFIQCIRQPVKTKNYPKILLVVMLTKSSLGTYYKIGEHFIQILNKVFFTILSIHNELLQFQLKI